MTLRDAVLENIDVHDALVDLIGVNVEDKGNDWRVKCLWHDDDHASMNVRKSDGVLHCFVCGYSGSIFDYYMEAKGGVRWNRALEAFASFVGVDENTPVANPTQPHQERGKKNAVDPDDEIESKPDERPDIPETDVMAWHDRLLTKETMRLNYLREKWGIDESILRRLQIGFDDERYTIPIRDATGKLVNVRRYMPDAKTEEKMKSYYQVVDKEVHSYGKPARLWPMQALAQPEVILVEGEKDAIVAMHHGFNAITTTGGAGRWRQTWNNLFAGKRVYICYDNDEAGQKGAINIAQQLEPFCGVYIVELPAPSSNIKGYDLTDFFVTEGGTADDFRQVLGDARTFSPPLIEKPGEVPAIDVPLSLASMAENMGKKLRTKVVVSGKNMAPYIVPKKLMMRCTCSTVADACETCPRWHRAGVNRLKEYEEEIILNAGNAHLLKLINCSDTQQKGYLKEIAHIGRKCNRGTVTVEETANLQQIIVIPELDAMAGALEEQEYVSRNAYYIGHDIIANRAYTAWGYTWPHPLNQTATHLFDHKDDMQDSIRSFEMTKEIYDELSTVFRPAAGQSIDEKLTDIYNYFVKNVHGIRGRSEIQLAFDLVWHSVLHFNFLGQSVRKGWLEGLIVGDTSQGKTELTTRMRDYYNLGQRITGEKTSAAGLIGGLQKIGEQWILQWGAYPQNDRRAILIDEYSSLKPDEIANMTDLRSTGVAEIVKIRTERTNARVRALLCSNLRSGYMLRDLMQGITGIKDLMGKNEDIRRLDFALTVATGEVSVDEINKPANRLAQPQQEYTRQACKNLVLWAWSRNRTATASQVEFTAAAEKSILEHARRLGEKYHPRIPLVEPSDQRLKIARLAAALACRLFSTDATGEIVIVTDDHVEYVVAWLEGQYDKPSMAYNSWSSAAWAADRFEPNAEEEIADYIIESPGGEDIVLFFSRQNKPFRQAELEAATGLDRETLKDFIRLLTRYSALSVDGNGYKAQPNMNNLIKKMKSRIPVGSKGLVLP